MSKVLKVVGTVAGIVALSIAIPGAGTAIGLSAASAASVSAIASSVAAVASIGSAILAKPPKQTVSGSLSQVIIAGEALSPYIIGETYSGGVLRYDKGWGGKVGDVQNPYRALVTVHSVAGPVQSLEGVYLDFEAQTISGTAATGYYADFLWRDYQLGARPESSALAAHWAGMPEWGSTSKLSSKAAIIWSLKFDKEGKRYSGGVPQLGAVWKGVKVYDPRLDSTYPGGSGAHRADDESTWTYSDNPALHALTYAIGRHHWVTVYYDPISMTFTPITPYRKKLFGIGIPLDGIDVASFVAHANVCDANGWVAGGIIYEPGDRWDNLKAILAAGSAEPVFSGARLSVRYDAPRVSIATITGDDLADGEVKVRAMQSWRDRLNSVIPKYRSSAHRWEYVAAEAVTVSTYVTEDGEEKPQEIQWNLVQDKDQAAQLAAYRLVNGRELAVEMTLKANARFWQPGDMLTLNIPEAGLESQKAVLLRRTVDPAAMTVQATFIGETAAKHAFALGQTGVAPPTPSLLSPQERDEAATVNAPPEGFFQSLITTSSQGTVSISGTSSTLTISNHDRIYADKTVAVTGATVTGLAANTAYWLYYDDLDRVGGAVAWNATTDFFTAQTSAANPGRHYGGFSATDVSGGTGTSGGGSLPPGAGGGSPYNPTPLP